MHTTMLHPVLLVAIEPRRGFQRANLVGIAGLVLAMIVLGLVIS